ncbi:MAG TPA: DUF87 domain-containing protein [Planctomycetes bacterium]|nr:DUF87 domain-containing protein [Planctomycetota bacterium]
MQDFEKLASFYLGRSIDAVGGRPGPDPYLYDAKDLTTHAVCVGMTGSGKTGLCVSLLEEAALDGIPVLAIDPKGDLGNLLLTFPDLRPEDFRPWVDPGEALRKGLTEDQFAAQIAKTWQKGLGEWGQDGDRIRRLRAAADFAIYTPGSDAGLPISILGSFQAPSAELAGNEEAFRDRILTATSGLLALVGIAADPLQSREHILVSKLLEDSWRAGKDLDIASLIQGVASPPFQQVGVFPLDAFFPSGDRMALAMRLNNLLASPGFGAWLKGPSLDVQRLLWTETGKPRVSILSIAHLSDEERMFFVTYLLNEVVAWMRGQSGTTSLRAILYMDEVFGYLPPTANPPSKRPLLTLLKQARAFGLGCVLATQNPVDLDYKAISNAGTWFLGRLQTERDKNRILDGLEGASASTGAAFDRGETERILSGLQSRQFLVNNVHDDGPVLLHTRWAMSYLRGPLTREQIRRLMDGAAKATPPAARRKAPVGVAAASTADAPESQGPPPVAADTKVRFIPLSRPVEKEGELVYRPSLLGLAQEHFISSRDGVDEWRQERIFCPLDDEDELDPWADEEETPSAIEDLEDTPEEGAAFAPLPADAQKASGVKRWRRLLKDHVYKTRDIKIFKCKKLKQVSQPGESEGDFRVRLAQAAREKRDLEIEKLRKRYGPKLARLQDRIRRAEQKVERERSQLKQQKVQTAISFGTTLLGALFGRKIASRGNIGRAATAARGLGRAARESGDVSRALETLESLRPRVEELEAQFEEDAAAVRAAYDVDLLDLDSKVIRPRKSDIRVDDMVVVWTPWRVDGVRDAEPLFD